MITVSFTDKASHLVATCSGKWKPRAVIEIIRQLKTEVQQSGHTRILVDWRDVSAPRMEYHRFLAGTEVAKHFSPPFKIAAIAKTESINRFAEDAAVNRGADLFVSDEEEQVLQWLLKDMSGRADGDDV